MPNRIVRGVQDFSHLAPEDLCLGSLRISGTHSSPSSDRTIERTSPGSVREPEARADFVLECTTRWGRYRCGFTSIPAVSTVTPAAHGAPPRPRVRATVAGESSLPTAGDLVAGRSLGEIQVVGSVTSLGAGGNTFEIRSATTGSEASYSVAVQKLADDGPQPAPTLRCVPYGSHWQQVLDFYRAPVAGPTPLLVQIHGGGWQALDKANTLGLHDRMLDAGISFASINYRFIRESVSEQLYPPVRGPLSDAAGAIQFLRYHANFFGIDPDRIGAVGGSAGGCSSVWLALHPDMADPESADPVERQSTRLWCAGGVDPQTSLDPLQMREWIPDIAYGAHAFGIFPESDEPDKAAAFERFLAARPALLGYIREYSPYEHADANAPPIYCSNPNRGLEPTPGEKGWSTHAPQFGSGLKARMDELGCECYHHYKGGPRDPYDGDIGRFFIEVLKRRR